MAYYYKIIDSKDILPTYKGFHLHKVKEHEAFGPNIKHDFSKHVLVELLDDTTPESKLWSEMGIMGNKNIIHKRITIDSHRIKCRRAIIICVSSDEAKHLAQKLSQTKIMNRCICAVVIEDLLSDLCLFEKQIIQFDDKRSQHQLLYIFDLSRTRGPLGLTQFLKEKFSPFGTILSILICSYDDVYAYPEGVIKFSYLSEAFAAELAFDQFVVGKERLSVTAHHNILLSQCDLRVRLRDAQWYCDNNNSKSTNSCFNSSIQSYKLNSLTINDQLSQINNECHTIYDALGDTLPAFSQYNLCNDSLEYDFDKTVPCEIKNISDREQSIDLSTHKKSLHCNHSRSSMNNKSCVINSSVQQIDSSETLPIEINEKKIISCVNKSTGKSHSGRNIPNDSLLNIEKSYKNASDSASFVTCISLNAISNTLFLSPKKSSYRSFPSSKNNSVVECSSITSNYKKLPDSFEENSNAFEVMEEPLHKHTEKQRKKCIPSQKLCLRNQRTQSSQESVATYTQTSEKSLSDQETSQMCKQELRKNNSDLPTESLESTDVNTEDEKLSQKWRIKMRRRKKAESIKSSKVADWLLQLPTMNMLSPDNSGWLSELQTYGEKPPSKRIVELHSASICAEKKLCIGKTPVLESDVAIETESEILHPDYCSSENENPNKITLISSDCDEPILLTGEYKSPLQMWLKQELICSVNNSAFVSEEISRCFIIYATKTKNIMISVGCSHMTCDSCYPESTALLLGYS